MTKDIVFPSFVHETELEQHNFKGSLKRHLAVEKALLFLLKILDEGIGDAVPGYSILEIPFIIAFGLNCNFPTLDIGQYVVWHLRGYP